MSEPYCRLIQLSGSYPDSSAFLPVKVKDTLSWGRRFKNLFTKEYVRVSLRNELGEETDAKIKQVWVRALIPNDRSRISNEQKKTLILKKPGNQAKDDGSVVETYELLQKIRKARKGLSQQPRRRSCFRSPKDTENTGKIEDLKKIEREIKKEFRKEFRTEDDEGFTLLIEDWRARFQDNIKPLPTTETIQNNKSGENTTWGPVQEAASCVQRLNRENLAVENEDKIQNKDSLIQIAKDLLKANPSWNLLDETKCSSFHTELRIKVPDATNEDIDWAIKTVTNTLRIREWEALMKKFRETKKISQELSKYCSLSLPSQQSFKKIF